MEYDHWYVVHGGEYVWSLNLTGAPIHGLVDCIAVSVLR
jgi:hypothetical protein